ncbi:MAG: flagellar protein FlaG [Planctomycetota bacterium]
MDGVSAGRVDRNVQEFAQSILRPLGSADLVAGQKDGAQKAVARSRDLTRIQTASEGASEASSEGSKPPEVGISREDLEALSENLNKVLADGTGIRFQLSDDGDDVVVQVVNVQSEEVIRSIPSDHVAELRENFRDFQGSGVLLDRQA